MATPITILYLHGFASSPGSHKAQIYKKMWEAEGRTVVIPDLNEDDFEHMTITRSMNLVRHEAKKINSPYVLVGSSLGGYTAVLSAETKEDPNLKGLILMAPAFNFYANFKKSLGSKTIDRWESMGRLPMMHYAYDEERMLSFDFAKDALQHSPYPDIGTLPCLLMHGLRDDVVPVELSKTFVEKFPHVEAHFLHGEHDLKAQLPEMKVLVRTFLNQLDDEIG